MGKYLTSPAGIFKIITAVLGVVIFGLAIASWPRESTREAVKKDLSDAELWRFYIFFAFSIIALLYSVVTVLAFTFMGKMSDGIKKVDGGASILMGLLLLITAALLLQEMVSQYNDLVEAKECNDFSTKGLPFGKTSGLAGTRSIEDDNKAIDKCETDNFDDWEKNCKCQIKTMLKFGVNVAAASIGILNFVVFCVAGGLGLKG